MTRYPKLLPWMAKRYDIPVGLAEKLWRRALGDAIELAGCTEGPEVCRFANERFLDLIESESDGDLTTSPAPGSDWFWRHQRRMAALTFTATNASVCYWEKVWRKARLQRMIA